MCTDGPVIETTVNGAKAACLEADGSLIWQQGDVFCHPEAPWLRLGEARHIAESLR